MFKSVQLRSSDQVVLHSTNLTDSNHNIRTIATGYPDGFGEKSSSPLAWHQSGQGIYLVFVWEKSNERSYSARIQRSLKRERNIYARTLGCRSTQSVDGQSSISLSSVTQNVTQSGFTNFEVHGIDSASSGALWSCVCFLDPAFWMKRRHAGVVGLG